MDPAVSVRDLAKRFRIYHERNQSLKIALMRGRRAQYEEFWALRGVDLDVQQGKMFGLVGHNGSGKSTLLKCMARILVPDRGTVSVQGRVSALLELGAGFHAELSGRDNVYLNGSILGLSKRDIDARFDEIVGFAGLEHFIDSPVKNYSSGMYVRLGFSVAINVEPDILLVDEVLAVGDEEFQRRSMDKFRQFKADGRTIVVVSHSLGTMQQVCDEVAWLDHGRVLGVGDPADVIGRYAGSTNDVAAAGPPEEAPPQPVRVTGIELLGPGGRVGSVESGQPAVFRILFEADGEVTEPVFRLRVSTPGGVEVAVPSTRGTAAVPARLRGTGHVDLSVDQLPLAAGTYDVGVSVGTGQQPTLYGALPRALQLTVDAGPDGDVRGLVNLGGTWGLVQRPG